MAGATTTISQLVNVRSLSFNGKLALELECQKHAEECIGKAMELIRDPATRPQHKLAGIFGILDRAYGKPMERSLNLSLSDNPDSKQYQAMSTRELLTLAANRLDKSQVINALGENADSGTAKTAPGIDFETEAR